MIVELISRQGDKIEIKRLKDGKTFMISPDVLDAASQALIKEKIKTIKVVYPPLEADVVISKRRKKDNGSYYMTEMTTSAKVTVTNEDKQRTSPPCSCNIIFVGQSQQNTDRFKVLSNQAFDLTPTPKGSSFSSDSFDTQYDSDNKGNGNLGGYKYVGYLLIVAEKDESVILTKTLYSYIKKALNANTSFAATIREYDEGTILTKKMTKPSSSKTNTLFPRD